MIETKNLFAGYGKKTVLKNVSAAFLPGKLNLILGPNGCGKSTLLKALCGILPLQSGQVLLGHSPLSSFSSSQLACRLSYLPQSRPLPSLTALELVLHGRYPHLRFPKKPSKDDENIALEALRQVGLIEEKDTLLPHLSGGQRQKAYLAMALSQQTEIILLDEPTTFLDPGCQLEIWALCQKLCRQGRTIIAICHDLPQALRYGEHLMLLSQGQMLFQGNADALLATSLLEDTFSISLTRLDSDTFRMDSKEVFSK